MGIHNVNGPNHIFGVNQVSGAKEAGKTDFLNTVFGNHHPKYVENTPFSGEEQHILGLFANVQDNVMIED